jgi:hypothetical protein
LTTLWWMADDLNNPGRLEYYMMMIGAEVRRGHVKHPKKVQLEDMRVRFKRSETDDGQEEWTAEELKTYSDWLKQIYLARWSAKPQGT